MARAFSRSSSYTRQFQASPICPSQHVKLDRNAARSPNCLPGHIVRGAPSIADVARSSRTCIMTGKHSFRFGKPETKQAATLVALVEFNGLQVSRRLLIRHRIPSSLPISAQVNRVQDGEGAPDAEHASDRISDENAPQCALHMLEFYSWEARPPFLFETLSLRYVHSPQNHRAGQNKTQACALPIHPRGSGYTRARSAAHVFRLRSLS